MRGRRLPETPAVGTHVSLLAIAAVCPPGTFSDGNATDCSPCNVSALQYQDEWGQRRCKMCACCGRNHSSGLPCLENGIPTPAILLGCPGDGTDGPGECVDCLPGKHSNPEAGDNVDCITCSACAAGKWRTNCQGISAGECRACASGKFKAAGARTSVWNATCSLCPRATYSQANNLSGTQACSDCPEGRYNDAEGQGQCKLCSAGPGRCLLLAGSTQETRTGTLRLVA